MAEEKKAEPGNEGAPTRVSERAEREKSFSRRALIQAGWTIPVIMAVNPLRALAVSGFGDEPFNDHIDLTSEHIDDGSGTIHFHPGHADLGGGLEIL